MKRNGRDERWTNVFDLTNRCLLREGLIVPVEEADDAEEESSSSEHRASKSGMSSVSSVSSNIRGSGGNAANLVLAKDLCSSLMMMDTLLENGL